MEKKEEEPQVNGGENKITEEESAVEVAEKAVVSGEAGLWRRMLDNVDVKVSNEYNFVLV